MDGVINVLKPAGMTSFDVIGRLRRIYGEKRIGHGGTLDPMAAGVLPVFVGRAARLIEYAPIHRKTYEAEFLIGLATDTEDATGRVIETGRVEADPCVWEKAAAHFRGPILQVPSMYSAKQVNGRRAYDLAREGKAVELPAKAVEIFDLTLREVSPPYLRLSVTCSSGTYVRALGRDLGRLVGSPLTMSFLLRREMGPFLLEDAKTLEEIEAAPEAALLPIAKILTELPAVFVDASGKEDFFCGRRKRAEISNTENAAVYCGEEFLGIGRVEGGVLHPKKVFN